jgi:hypothetical protein
MAHGCGSCGVRVSQTAPDCQCLRCAARHRADPFWSPNRLNRLVRLPKRYLVDPAFAGPLLGVDARAVLRNGDLLGRLLDSFVMAQLRAECTLSEFSPHLFHVRDANSRHEVDIFVELGDGRVVGIEVEADSARDLMWHGTCAGSGTPSETASRSASCCIPGRVPSGWMSQSPRGLSVPYGAKRSLPRTSRWSRRSRRSAPWPSAPGPRTRRLVPVLMPAILRRTGGRGGLVICIGAGR